MVIEAAAAGVHVGDDDEQTAIDLLLESMPPNRSPESVTSLELFMAPYPRPLGLHRFHQLTSLEIIACGLTTLHGISSVPGLQRLIACENEIDAIAVPLPARLHILDLRSNRISCIEGLPVSLRHLNLAENRLRTLAGIGQAPELRTLSVARNALRHFATHLLPLTELVEVNLSGNDIGDLDEVRQLRALPGLRTLYLSDPHFGANPVCGLCNYRTLLVHDLPGVDLLDAQQVTDAVRISVQVVYAKKVMYYNMRMKSAKKAATDAVRQAQLVRQAYADAVQATVTVAERQLRDLDDLLDVEEHRSEWVRDGLSSCPLISAASLSSSSSSILGAGLPHKRARLQSLIQNQADLLHQLDEDFLILKQRLLSESRAASRRLEIELQSGGNIRLDRGQPGQHAWADDVVADLLARFDREAFLSEFEIDRVQVTGVIGVHNRHLKMRFESGDVQPSRVRLVTGGRPDDDFDTVHQILLDGAQYGLRPDRLPPGRPSPWRLASDLLDADRDRLRALCGGLRHRRILDRFLILIARLRPSTPTEAAGDEAAHPTTTAAGSDSDPDMDVTLPEYLIQYRYLRAEKPIVCTEPIRTFADQEAAHEEAALPGAPDPRTRFYQNSEIDRALAGFRELWSPGQYAAGPGADAQVVLRDPPRVPDAGDKRTAVDAGAAVVEARRLGRCGALDPTAADHVPHWAGIPYLDLHGHAIGSLTGPRSILFHLTTLQTLILSFNEIVQMDGLQYLVALVHLDLSHNRIVRISALDGLHQLRRLYLNHNRLSERSDRDYAYRTCPHLAVLDLRYNPVEFRDEDRPAGVDLDWDLVRSGLDRQPTTGASSQPVTDSDVDTALSLCLDHVPIRSLRALTQWTFAVLRSVSVCNCALTDLRGLAASCPRLETLCADDNQIADLAPIFGLRHLRRLELNNNRLSALQGLEQLGATLVELSLESNLLDVGALAVLARGAADGAAALAQLYLGGNRIADLGQVVRYLRPLPGLVVLDLVGNAVCAEPHYRLAVIFHLKRLKVLDGCSVTGSEVDACKDEFEGRVTDEFLRDLVESLQRTGAPVDRLDLSDAQIRAIDPIRSDRLQGIRDVNLENNQLSRVEVLGALPDVVVLNLGQNRISAVDEGAWTGLGLRLQVLILSANRITDLSRLPLGALPGLRRLDLHGNDLRQVGAGVFVANSELRHLNLADNVLVEMSVDELRGLGALRHLDLSGNALRSLHGLCSELFLHCPRFLTLACNGNRVAQLTDLDVLARVPTLTDLSLVGNPVARRHLYRPTLLRACPTLRCVDGRDVTDADRARVTALFDTGPTYAASPVVLQATTIPSLPMALIAAPPAPGQYAGAGPGSALVSQLDPNAPFAVRGLLNHTRRATAPPALVRSPRRLSLVGPGIGAGPGWRRMPPSSKVSRAIRGHDQEARRRQTKPSF